MIGPLGPAEAKRSLDAWMEFYDREAAKRGVSREECIRQMAREAEELFRLHVREHAALWGQA